MNNHQRNTPIAPQEIAAKLERIKNFEAPSVAEELQARPRFVEIFWFLQWVSNSENYPGGLTKFADDLVDESLDLIGPETMLKIGHVKKYTAAQLESINKDSEYSLGARRYAGKEDEDGEREVVEGYEDALKICLNEARWKFSKYLFLLCEMPDTKFTRNHLEVGEREFDQSAPWYFPRVAEAILAFMDRRKARIAATIGETEITRQISKWLEVARAAKRAVLIIGTERFGKTEGVRNWCLQNPGLARLVQTPASNAQTDLLREVARALGIHTGPNERGIQLREMIDYVLAHSGLMLIFDECQFLLPGNYSRSPAAARLNWYRRSVMDKGIASALVATPQSYKPAKDRFVKRTGYAIGQFDERILKTVTLPNELAREDLVSIARIHFPNLPAPYLEYVVEKTIATERNYVSDIEKIATLSKVSAEQAGRKSPTLADIKSAIADVLPALPAGAPEAQPAAIQSVSKARTTKERRAALIPSRLDATFSSHDRTQIPAELAG